MQKYEYNPNNLEQPFFIVLEKPISGEDYYESKKGMKIYRNQDGMQVYFRRSKFPSYKYIVEILKTHTSSHQLKEGLAELIAYQRIKKANKKAKI